MKMAKRKHRMMLQRRRAQRASGRVLSMASGNIKSVSSIDMSAGDTLQCVCVQPGRRRPMHRPLRPTLPPCCPSKSGPLKNGLALPTLLPAEELPLFGAAGMSRPARQHIPPVCCPRRRCNWLQPRCGLPGCLAVGRPASVCQQTLR